MDALPVGEQIAGFRITKMLGAGSFGITYEADDLGLDRRVALKEFFPFDYARRLDGGLVQSKSDQAGEVFSWALERFSDEAKTLAKFSHPNIVRVTQIIPGVNQTAYIVMEYLEGVTLEDWVLKHGLPSADQTKRVFRQLLDGCEAIHKYGILHRDIKPSNVMLAGEGGQLEGARPVLIDFGSARDLALQRTGFSAVVTDGYSPPEQYSRSTTQGPPADLYALAATVFYLLTGQTPPPSAARLSDPLPPIPPERLQAFGPKFIQQLLRGLELQVDKRPQTVAEWRKSLDLDDQPQSVAPGGGLSRRTMLIAGGGVGALAVAGGAGWWFLQPANLSGLAQPLRLAATKTLGQLGIDAFAQIAPVAGGAMIAAHRLTEGAPHMLALQIDNKLEVQHEWTDEQADGEAVSILPAKEGGAHVGGRSGSAATIVRLSSDWKPMWRVERGEGRVTAILPNSKGVLIGIEALDKSGARIETLDDSGKLIWGIDVDKGKDESVQRVIALKKGGYAVLGWGTQARETSEGNFNEAYTWAAILDANGKTKQRAQTNGLGAASGTDLIELVGKIFIVGRTSESKPGSAPHMMVWALNADGTEAWIKSNYPITPSSMRAVAGTPGNALYAAGWANDPPRMRVAQIGATGDLVWSNVYPGDTGVGGAIDMAMRGDGDGFALLSSPGNAEVNQLVVARIMT